MFESRSEPGADDVRALAVALSNLSTRVDAAALIDRIAALEELKRAASAAQVRATAAFAASRRAAAEAAGVPAGKRSRGVADQVALARGESPHRGGQHLGLAEALAHEMPHTLAALTRGAIDEWTATVLVRESAVLTRQDRATLDARMAAEIAAPGTGSGRLTRAAHGIVCELDARAVARRAAKAATERRVSIRPAPDTMTYVTALLPVAEGVSVYAALDVAAKAAAASGDERGRGQVMADALVARVTGREPVTAPVPVTVHLVMTDAALLAGDDTAATVGGHGPVPAPVARSLVAAAAAADRAWVRRLFTRPGTGSLVALESRRRLFPAGLATLITLRDQTCATPWCDAPIRHLDHVTAHSAGGPTSLENGQGLCAHCNLTKETPGWTTTGTAGDTTVTTPTGHIYQGTCPPPLGYPPTVPPEPDRHSVVERALQRRVEMSWGGLGDGRQVTGSTQPERDTHCGPVELRRSLSSMRIVATA